MSKFQSMINNLKSISGNRYGAKEALRLFSDIKEKTSRSEKDLLVSMVLFAVEHNEEYRKARDLVISSDTPECQAKSCLTLLRSLTGRTEQSLLVSMINYSAKNDESLSAETPSDAQ